MGRNRFVQPTTVRYELSDGDWAELKGRLTYLESQRLATAAFSGLRGQVGGVSAEITLDSAAFALAKFEAWIVDWSFQGPDGRAVPVSRDSFSALDEEAAAELIEIINRHAGFVADEKKVKSIETLLAPISPS